MLDAHSWDLHNIITMKVGGARLMGHHQFMHLACMHATENSKRW